MVQIILLAFRYLSIRWTRTLFNILAIVFGVAVLFASSSLIRSINVNLQRIARQPGEPDISVMKGDDQSFPAEIALADAASIDGVEFVSGVFRRSFAMPVPGDLGMSVPGSEGVNAPVITLIGVIPETALKISYYPLTKGRFLSPEDEYGLIIPASLAREGAIEVGDNFTILTPIGSRVFDVVGLLDDSGIPSIQMIIPLKTAQTLFDAPTEINAIDIALEPGVDRDQVEERVLGEMGRDFEVRTYPEPEAGLIEASLYFFGMMALFMGAFLIFNSFRTAVVERRIDLANLRMLGADRRQIMQLVLVESLMQGILGSAIGLLAGAGFATFLVDLVKNTRWFPGFDTLMLKHNPGGAIVALCLGIGTSLFAGYIPARAAGRISPITAVHPVLEKEGQVPRWQLIAGGLGLIAAIVLLIQGEDTAILGGLLFLVAAVMLTPLLIQPAVSLLHPILSLLMPKESDLARGNILRQPGRAAVVTNGLMSGFAVFTASAALVVSLNHFFVWMYTANYLSDVILMPLGGETLVSNDGAISVEPHVATQLADLQEVAAVSRLRATDLMVKGERINILGIDPEYAGDLRPFLIYEGDQESALKAMSAGRAIFINDRLSMQLDLKIGDSLTLDTPHRGTQEYSVVALGDDIDIRPDQPGLMMANSMLEIDFGVNQDLVLYLDLVDDASVETVMEDIKAVVRAYPQLVPVDLSTFQDAAIQRAQDGAGFFYLMAIVVLVPALLGLLNTLTINVLERKREIGILRAIGGDRSQVRRTILVEVLYLGITGAVIGILVGMALGISFVQLWDMALTARAGLTISVPVVAIITGLVAGLVLTLSVSMIPARYAARLNIVDALRYE